MGKVWGVWVLWVLAMVSGAEAQGVYTFQASGDGWVNEVNPAANYGNNTYLSVKDRSGLAEAYLKFSLGDLPEMPIGSASLFLYQYQGTNSPGDVLDLHFLSNDWNEATLTWDNRPSCDPTAVGFLNITGETNISGWREWSGLERPIAGWPEKDNFSLVLENNRDGQNNELFARFYSSEYSDPGLRPYLKVTTTPEPVSAALFLLGAGALAGIRRQGK